MLGQPHGTSMIVSRMQSGVTQKDGVGAGQEAFEVVLVIVGQDILGIFDARRGVMRRLCEVSGSRDYLQRLIRTSKRGKSLTRQRGVPW